MPLHSESGLNTISYFTRYGRKGGWQTYHFLLDIGGGAASQKGGQKDLMGWDIQLHRAQYYSMA